MALLQINLQPTDRQLRQFAAIWLPAFAAVAGWLLVVKAGSWPMALAVWASALIAASVGLLRPQWMRPVYLGWMFASYPIGWLISHLVLAAAYYLLLTPIGLLMRAFGRDSMTRRFDRNAASYWVEHDPHGETARYFRQL
jgi:hypothetical protein